MKRSRWLLIALTALVLLVGAISYRVFRTGREVIGPIDDEDAPAVQAFVEWIGDGWSFEREKLRVDNDTVAIDRDNGLVIRQNPAGEVVWSTRPDGALWRWRPGLVTNGRFVYFYQTLRGVAAFDAATGHVVWQALVPADCFLLSEDLMILAYGSQVVAFAAATGAEAFRLSLPVAEEFRPLEIKAAANLLLVQDHESLHGEANGFAFDRTGKIRHQFGQQVLAVVQVGADRLFLTSADVRRITPDDRTVWLTPFEGRRVSAGGGITEARGGDFLAYLYGTISNSGVRVVRIDAASGTVRWEASCKGLSGVTHSEYYHSATAEWLGDQLRVISRGSAGNFVERLDGRTGKSLRRGEQRGW